MIQNRGQKYPRHTFCRALLDLDGRDARPYTLHDPNV